jgi:hypothetical protein
MMKSVQPSVLVLVVFAFAISGCQSSKPANQKRQKQQTSAQPSFEQTRSDRLSGADGCDARLQDIGGLFLMYSLMNHRLPESLDELRTLPGASDVGDFTCPVSKVPYIYDRNGIPVPSGAGRIILYDAAPSHGGQRLCLSLSETGPGGALVTKVIALPEIFFKAR